jgi:hypothetical protein
VADTNHHFAPSFLSHLSTTECNFALIDEFVWKSAELIVNIEGDPHHVLVDGMKFVLGMTSKRF